MTIEQHIGTTGKVCDPEGVNSPKHYNAHPSGIEIIEIVRHMSFNVGSAFKYVARLGEKIEPGLTAQESMAKDLKKAIWYLEDERHNFEAGKPLSESKIDLLVKFVSAEPDPISRQYYSALLEHSLDGNREALKHACAYAQDKLTEITAQVHA